MRSVVRIGIISFLVCLVLGGTLLAQTAAGSLQGQVTDPSGAVVVKATVTAKAADGKSASGVSNSKGTYEIKSLAPGAYTLTVTAKGFSPETQPVTIAPGAAQTLNIELKIAVEQQSVEVQDDSTTVSTDASANAATVVLKGKDLDALSDDPDDLQSDLEALAGPAAGPNGGEIYIDGFTNGKLPPKSAIREIRVNQNPFSAQFDHMGFGRVEVFTKPGSDAFHGQFMVHGNGSFFNSLNPYLKRDLKAGETPNVPDYHTLMYSGNLSGPISKKASFFFNVERRNMDEVSMYNAKVPCADPLAAGCNLGYAPDSGAVSSPRIHTEISPRLDYQLTTNNTLMARYEYETSSSKNSGVSGFSLPSQARNSEDYEHSLRITDTQVLNSTTINETRLQFMKSHASSLPLTPGMTISVQDMFTMGGNNSGVSTGDEQNLEIQNYTSKIYGKHFIKFGGRVRRSSQDNYDTGWLGSVEYKDMASYYSDISTSTDPLTWTNWDQFRFTAGNSRTSVSQTDAGLYVEDDWRVRSNVTLSYGLRFETQNNVDNHVNLAPRVGVAWGIGKGTSPKTVLRAGFGMFYDRFSEANVMKVRTSNDANPQDDYVVNNETGTMVLPDISTYLAQNQKSDAIKYIIAPSLKIPYVSQYAVTIERQLSPAANVSVSYVGSRGLHQLVTENLDAFTAKRPFHYQYVSAGTFKQNQVMMNSRVSLGRYLSLFGWYVYGRANSNTGNGYPSDPQQWNLLNLSADWGRSAFDVRHRGMVGGSINLPLGFRLNPMIMVQSGSPYNVTTGTDDNKDNIRNDRPWFSGICPNGDYATNRACFSTTETPYGRVPINYLTGPGMVVTNLRLSKTIGFGSKGEQSQAGQGGNTGGPGGPGGFGGPGGGRGGHGGHGGRGGMMGMLGGGGTRQKYNLTFSVSARNLLNTFNEGNPSGVMTSGNFGKSTSMGGWGGRGSANRRIDLGLMFNF